MCGTFKQSFSVRLPFFLQASHWKGEAVSAPVRVYAVSVPVSLYMLSVRMCGVVGRSGGLIANVVAMRDAASVGG